MRNTVNFLGTPLIFETNKLTQSKAPNLRIIIDQVCFRRIIVCYADRWVLTGLTFRGNCRRWLFVVRIGFCRACYFPLAPRLSLSYGLVMLLLRMLHALEIDMFMNRIGLQHKRTTKIPNSGWNFQIGCARNLSICLTLLTMPSHILKSGPRRAYRFVGFS